MNRVFLRNIQAAFLLLLLPLLGFQPKMEQHLGPMTKYLQSWRQSTAPERVLLHFSQPFYASGDTVRFTAFVLEGATFKPALQSSRLQVEFRGTFPENSLKLQFQIKEGIAVGSIPLSDSMPSGHYEVVAYTPAMQKTGISSLPGTALRILGPALPEQPENQPLKEVKSTLAVYPEGGKLVAGINGNLAVKFSDKRGKGAVATGKIVDATAKVISNFKTDPDGKALFQFMPILGQTYQVIATDSSGSKTSLSLPTIEEEGIGMQVNAYSDSLIKVQVQANAAWEQAFSSEEVLVALISVDNTVQTQKVNMSGATSQEVTFSKRNLPPGKVQVLVVNDRGQVEGERWAYVTRPNALRLQMKTDRQRYGRREKVTLTLTATDAAGTPLETAFSLAVRENLSLMPGGGSSNALSKDFSPEEKEKALDWEMRTIPAPLTDWPQVKPEVNAQADTVHQASLAKRGLAIDATGKPLPNATLLFFGDDEAGTLISNAQQDGTFTLDSPELTSHSRLVYEVLMDGRRAEGARIQWKEDVFQEVSRFKAPLVLTAQERLYLRQAALRKAVTPFFPGLRVSGSELASFPKPLNPVSIGSPDRSFDLTKYVEFRNVEEVIKEVLPITNLVTTKNGKEPRIYSLDFNASFKEHPLYLVNGYPTLNNQWVLNLPASEVQKIGLYYSDARLKRIGLSARNGVISINTVNPDLHPDAYRDERTLYWNGFAQAFPFKTPSYELTGQERVPDFRPLLFWAPFLKTDAKGQVTITFYTSDEVGSFTLEAVGGSKQGLMGRQTHTFQVAASL